MDSSAPAATSATEPLPGWRDAVARTEALFLRAEAQLQALLLADAERGLERLPVPDLLAPQARVFPVGRQ